jgi:glycosyltransferase involved in cell wall biosynthesis
VNILFLTQEDDQAGAAFSVSYLAIGLAERGHLVYVGSRAQHQLKRLVEGTAVKHLHFEPRSRFDLLETKKVSRWVRDYGIHIINAQSSKDRYISIWIKWFFEKGVRVVHTRRQYPRSAGGWLQRMLYTKGSDKIVVISEGLKRIFEGKGYPSAHLAVIHNGIPRERYKQWSWEKVNYYRQKFGIEAVDIVIGSVSRRKKQDQIIRSVALLNDPRMRMLFVGVEQGDFDSLARELGVADRLICTGHIPATDVLNFYKIFAVNVLASTSDGFGLALVEAMAMGCPVIGTNFGGIPDVIEDGVSGLLFEDGEVKELARRITEIVSSKERSQALSLAGLAAVERFSIERTVDGYEKLFESLLSSRPQ